MNYPEYFKPKADEIVNSGRRVFINARLGVGGRPIMVLAADQYATVDVVTVGALMSEWRREFKHHSPRKDSSVRLSTVFKATKDFAQPRSDLLIVELGSLGPVMTGKLLALAEHYSVVWIRDLMLRADTVKLLDRQEFKLVTI